ncbi:hypothetical protein PUMCH_004300 [Australozyma saopauloensis]|uniref:DDHD domain-containing protein n=1 Tax=Australozyma saopauloensis TaxID=291208 RepID=A0AAX4HEZ9_9ASCO|nr:hypothetical protein PUMCH_004300 [[Candida] saopauloensis]
MFSRTARLIFSRRAHSKAPKKLVGKWYYNTDSPISKPDWYEYASESSLEKFIPFSKYDNHRLEKAYAAEKSTIDVKEDRLYQVEFDSMQLSPVYWPGPVYEVRRGTWFARDGTPLDAKLTEKLEQSYRKIRPFKFEEESDLLENVSRDLTTKFNQELKSLGNEEPVDIEEEKDVADLGEGKAVIFFDEKYGAIFPKNISSFQVNMIRSIQPSYGTLMSVTPIQRGYTEGLDSSVVESVKSAKVSSLTQILQNEVATFFSKSTDNDASSRADTDEDKSHILKNVMEADSKEDLSALNSKRNIKHLVFCVHGIGQLLGGKYESVNFTHSINVMRSTMREVFTHEAKYQQLAYGDQYDKKSEEQKINNTIQVLPISWRHQVLFHPQKALEGKKKQLPSLNQLNIDGVRPLRNVIGDVALDVLLFYEPEYLRQILKAVSSEINRVYKLFKTQNPDFDGKVHLFGHSLGSAICFDLLSQQKPDKSSKYNLDFDVENFFCVGLPVGMFKVLQQKTIEPRVDQNTEEISLDSDFAAPKCKNLYNVFHPCDPISYRLEPLIDLEFAKVKPEEVPFALQGFNTQVQNLTSLSDDIQDKILLASSWFSNDNPDKLSSGTKKKKRPVEEENALGDIISTLTSSKVQKTSTKKNKIVEYNEEQLKKMIKMNRTGRVDYSLPMGVFSIAIVSALSAHISYFEDQETVGFVMKEILSSDEPPVTKRKVTSFK